jgi:hypothetical protein
MIKWMLLGLLLVPGLAMAQAVSAQQFAAVMQDAGHRAEVLSAAQATPAWAALACKTATYAQMPEIGVYVPVRFDKDGAPVAGEWREGLLASGCGAKMRLNVLTEVTAPSTLASGALLPGATIADPILQNAAQIDAVRAAGGLPRTCRDAFVLDTRFDGFQGAQLKALPDGEITAAWTETWSLDLCGTEKVVTMHFLPSAQGVSVAASLVAK